MTSSRVLAVLAGMILFGGSVSVFASHMEPITGQVAPQVSTARPQELDGVGIDEQLGHQLDLSLPLRDEAGKSVTLGSFFDGKRPVIVSPVYFACPGLCNFHLNGLTEALKDVDMSAGTKFQVLAISFDPKETPELATKKKETYMKLYSRHGTEVGWHFLTGDEASVTKMMGSVGFKYHWDDKEKQWAHTSSAIVASPTGTITRYLPGIVFDPKNLRLAILEAGEGKVGSFVDQLVLYCFHYNPSQSKYTVYAFNIMKLGGALTMLVLGLWLLPHWIRSRRRMRGEARSS